MNCNNGSVEDVEGEKGEYKHCDDGKQERDVCAKDVVCIASSVCRTGHTAGRRAWDMKTMRTV